jgi:hypothetical protein
MITMLRLLRLYVKIKRKRKILLALNVKKECKNKSLFEMEGSSVEVGEGRVVQGPLGQVHSHPFISTDALSSSTPLFP